MRRGARAKPHRRSVRKRNSASSYTLSGVLVILWLSVAIIFVGALTYGSERKTQSWDIDKDTVVLQTCMINPASAGGATKQDTSGSWSGAQAVNVIIPDEEYTRALVGRLLRETYCSQYVSRNSCTSVPAFHATYYIDVSTDDPDELSSVPFGELMEKGIVYDVDFGTEESRFKMRGDEVVWTQGDLDEATCSRLCLSEEIGSQEDQNSVLRQGTDVDQTDYLQITDSP